MMKQDIQNRKTILRWMLPIKRQRASLTPTLINTVRLLKIILLQLIMYPANPNFTPQFSVPVQVD
jgi:hypothetical protein